MGWEVGSQDCPGGAADLERGLAGHREGKRAGKERVGTECLQRMRPRTRRKATGGCRSILGCFYQSHPFVHLKLRALVQQKN